MKERQIPLTGDEVRAILAGTKTQMRRIVKNPDWHGCLTGDCPHESKADCAADLEADCPLGQPGDMLWVREAWAETDDENGIPIVVYRAGGTRIIGSRDGKYESFDGTIGAYETTPGFRSGASMPRWASRLSLRIKSVRVERVQEISEEDACWEGAMGPFPTFSHGEIGEGGPDSYRDGFAGLWNSINGPGAWARNDWVWVVGFEVRK